MDSRFFPSKSRRTIFRLGHIFVLVLLTVWVMGESVAVTVRVEGETCTAVLGERSSQIPCLGVEPGVVGLFIQDNPLTIGEGYLPPTDAAWQSAEVQDEDGTITRLALPKAAALQPLFNMLQEPQISKALIWEAPVKGNTTITARLRQPDSASAGILLLELDKNNGWLFQVNSARRQGSWWRWQDGGPAAPIAGIPYQKPLLAQAQSLLRLLLGGYWAALLFWALLWCASRVGRSSSSRRSWLKGTALQLKLTSILSDPAKAKLIRRGVLIAVICFVFGTTLWIADQKLERMPHVQDSITLLFQAETLARGSVWAPAPPIPESFIQEFLMVQNGKWFGQYAPGFPAVLTIGVWLGQPWVINPLLAALAVALLYTFGRLLFNRRVGLISAVLAACSPFFLFLSSSMMMHPAELFWTLLFWVSAVLAFQDPFAHRRALLAGLALGMLFLTRSVTAVFIAAPFIILWIITYRPRPAWKALVFQGGLILAGALPFLLLLLGTQYAITGSPWQDPRLIGRPFDKPGFGDDVGERQNAFDLVQTEYGTAVSWYFDPAQPPRGHTPARGLYNTLENWQALSRHLFGWLPLLTFSFFWLAFFSRRSKANWLLLAVLAVTVGFYVAYWSNGIMYGPRYYYAALPVLLLLTARGIQLVISSKAWASKVIGILFLLVLLAGSWLFYWPGALQNAQGYNFISREERQIIEANVMTPALIFVPASSLNWWEYGRFFSANTPWLDGPIVYARDLGPGENGRLRSYFVYRHTYLWHPETTRLHELPVSPAAATVPAKKVDN